MSDKNSCYQHNSCIYTVRNFGIFLGFVGFQGFFMDFQGLAIPKIRRFPLVFSTDSEYIFCFMIQAHFFGENHEICVKYQVITHEGIFHLEDQEDEHYADSC